MNSFGPVITAMVTPFDEYNQLNVGSLRKLIIHLLKHGSTSLVITGTTGEAPTLTAIERLRIWETAVDFAGGSVPIICGVGTNNTKTTIHNVKLAEEIGADGVLVVTPYYNKPNKIGLLTHYKEVANSTDLPIILYNIPSRTGVMMEPKTVAYLASTFDNIVGVKQSCPDMDKVTEMRILCPDDFSIYSGDDSLTLPMLSLGVRGVISVASHLFGSEIKSMIRNFKTGEVVAARNMHKKLYPVFRALFMAPNPTPVKAALAYKGIVDEYVRKPLVTLTEDEKIELFRVIDSVKKELSEES